MGIRILYKDCVIRCNPEPIAEPGLWRLRLAIQWKSNGVLHMQPVSGPTVFSTREEADILGIAYAQRVIDEKMPSLKPVRSFARNVPCSIAIAEEESGARIIRARTRD